MENEVNDLKGFERENSLLSLCGLNCGLCSMHLGGHCEGCGKNNQSCTLAKCSLQHHQVAYCFECLEYPCEKYQHIDDYDSFITHQNQKANLNKAKKIGIDNYNLEQQEKIKILHYLLDHYNDGRKKTFFCLAVNLLELDELKEGLNKIANYPMLSDLPFPKQCQYVVSVFENIAQRRNIILKLKRKKKV